MHDTKYCIAILHGTRDHAHGIEVINLVYGDALLQQLLVDAVEALNAAFDAGGNARFLELVSKNVLDAGKKLFPPRLNRLADLVVGDRVEIAEAEVLEFAANFAHPKAVRNWTVNVECFFRDFLLAVWLKMLERAHVVQTVGKLDENDANVIDHGEHHLA